MAIHTYGPSGGETTPVPGFHSTDGNTLHHWKFDGDGTDDGTVNKTVTANASTSYGPYEGETMCVRMYDGGTLNSASISGTATKTSGSITIAGWFWFVDGTPAANTALIGVRGPGSSGNPDTYNFPWELGINTSGHIRAFHQYDNKQDITATYATPVAEQEWVHLAASRSSDGLTWKVYQNGLEVATASGTAGDEWDGGGNQNTVRILHNSVGGECIAHAASCIVKDVTLDSTTALALYNDAKS